MYIIKLISTQIVLLLADLEALLNMMGAAAAKLKKRVDLNYQTRNNDLKRKLCGLHNTVLPLCSKARSILQQLHNSTKSSTKQGKARKGGTPGDPSPQINGRPNGRITGVDMRQLLLLLPFHGLIMWCRIQQQRGDSPCQPIKQVHSPGGVGAAAVVLLLQVRYN